MASARDGKTREAGKAAAVAPATWPVGVQIALGLIVTGGVFFLLGRWSHHEAAPVIVREAKGPALDLNRASKAELRLLPGLGDALAQRVFEHRRQFGPFASVEDLQYVKGIGPKTLDRLRPHLFVNVQESFVSTDEAEMPLAESKPPVFPSSKKASLLTGPINVNRADQLELQKLPGIGPKLSQRILDTRAAGHFQSIDELRRVPGIGPKTLEKIRPHVTLE